MKGLRGTAAALPIVSRRRNHATESRAGHGTGGVSAGGRRPGRCAPPDRHAHFSRRFLSFLPGIPRRPGARGFATGLLVLAFLVAAAPAWAQSGPTISIAADSAAVVEGTSATFTVTASAAPTSDLTVNLNVATTGSLGYGTNTGSQTVTIAANATTATYTLTTTGDTTREYNGSVTATVQSGAGYTVSSTAGSAEVVVHDDDSIWTATMTVGEGSAGTDRSNKGFHQGDRVGSLTDRRFTHQGATLQMDAVRLYDSDNRLTISVSYGSGATPPQGNFTWCLDGTSHTWNPWPATPNSNGTDSTTLNNSGLTWTIGQKVNLAFVASTDTCPTAVAATTPEISIAADSASVTEGTSATFTVTASTAPTSSLTVNLNVATAGSFGYGSNTGAQTVTIAANATNATYTLTTTGDTTRELNGLVTATVQSGTGYNVSSTAGSAEVVVHDDESIWTATLTVAETTRGTALGARLTNDNESRGAISDTTMERGGASRTVDRFLVNKSTTRFHTYFDPQSGNYTGATKLCVDNASFSWNPFESNLNFATNTIATTGGPSWTIGQKVNLALVASTETCPGAAAPTTPEISIAADSASVTEGTSATFTVTASTAPTSSLTVNLNVATAGSFGYGSNTGSQTVTIAANATTATYSLTTAGDTTREVNGSVTATVGTGAGYTVSSEAGSAEVVVHDNDSLWTATLTVGQSGTDSNRVGFGPGFGALSDTSAVRSTRTTVFNTIDLHKTNGQLRIFWSGSGTYIPAASYKLCFNGAHVSYNVWGGTSALDFVLFNTEMSWSIGDKVNLAVVESTQTCPGEVAATTPEISVTADNTAVTEGTSATFTVTASPAPTSSLTVNLNATTTGVFGYGTNTGSQTVTIAANATTATYTLTTTNDTTDERDGSVTVRVGSGTGYTVSSSAGVATTAVTDNDGTAPTWSAILRVGESGDAGYRGYYADSYGWLSDDTMQSGATTAEVNYVRSNVSASNLVVSTTRTGAPVLGTFKLCVDDASYGNYRPLRGQNPNRSITVAGANSTTWTAGQIVTLTMVGENASCPTAESATPATPEISIAADNVVVTEGTSATFTVTASPAPTSDLTVNLSVATTGSFGYGTNTGSQTVTIAANATTATYTLTTAGDTTREVNGSVTATVGTGTDYTVSTTAGAATTAVHDDDSLWTATMTVGASGTDSTQKGFRAATLGDDDGSLTSKTITVGQNNAGVGLIWIGNTNALTLSANPAQGTDSDTSYKLCLDASGFSWTPFSSSSSIATHTNHGLSWSTGQKVNVALIASTDTCPGATAPTTPEISIAADSATVTEGTSASFTVTAAPAPAADLSVALNVTTVGTFDYGTNIGSQTVTITASATTATFTLTTSGDTTDEPNGSVTAAVGTGTGYTVSSTAGSATVTVNDDDDTPTATLVLTPSSIGENAGVSTVTATLNRASSAATTLTVSAAPVSPAVAADFTLSANKSLTIAAGATTSTGTVTITAVDNNNDTADKSVTVSATATNSHAVTAPADQTLTITDDEGTPSVTLSLGSTSIGENGGSTMVTGTLSAASSSQSTVTITVTPTAPATADDFTLSSNTTLTFAANATTSTGTVSITAVDNNVDTANKSLAVSGTSSASYTVNGATLTITDDEGTPSVTLSLGSTSIGESGGSTTVTGTLSAASSSQSTVTVTVTPTAPATTSDFTLSANTTLTFAANATTSTGAVTVTAVDNAVDAPNKSLAVTGTSSASHAVTGATLTITDDEATPAATLVLSPASIGENAGVSTVTATLNRASSAATTLTVSAAAVSPAVAGDFALSANKTLTIAAGATTSTGTVTITANDNAIDAPNKSVTVSATASNSHAVTAPANQTLTITDDDATPAATLVLSPASIGENAGVSTVTATLNRASSAATTLTVSAAAVSPAVAGDFALSANKTLTIAAGATTSTGTVTITANDNAIDAPNKSVTVSATASNSHAVTAPANQTLTITDDDATPAATLVLSPASIGENAGVSTVTATLNRASSAATTLTVSAAAVSPAVAGDFALSANKTLTIAAGATTSTGTVTITANDNAIDAPNKSVTVSATATNSHAVTAPANQTLTITDDEGTPSATLSLSSASIGEDGGSTTVTGTLSVASASQSTVTVNVTPTAPASTTDYSLSSNTTLTFAAEATTSTGAVSITANDNDIDNADRSVTVGGTSSAGFAVNSAALTITDDDTAGVTVSKSTVTVDEGASDTWTVVLTSEPTGTVTVTPSSNATGVATVSPASLTFDATNWDRTQAVTVSGVDDGKAGDSDRTATISHSVSGYGSVTASSVAVTVRDTTARSVTVSKTSVSVNEVGSGTTSTYTVVLDVQPVGAVTVTPASNRTGVATVSPSTLNFSSADWDAPKTVTVTGVSDGKAGTSNRSATISHSISGYGTVTVASVSVTVNDNTPRSVTVSKTSVSMNETGAGTTDTYTVMLDTQPVGAVTVRPSSDTTAVATVSPSTLNFSSTDWNAPKTVTVTGVSDGKAGDSDRTARISHSISGYGTVTVASVSVTVNDNTPRSVTVSRSSATVNEGGSIGYTVVLTTEPLVTVRVNATSGATGNATVEPASVLFTTTNWSSPKSLTVRGVADMIADGKTRSATISHSAEGYGTVSVGSLTVTVNDTTAREVDASRTSIRVGEKKSDTYTVVLSARPGGNVTVTPASSKTGVATTSPSSLSFTTSNWNTPQTVTVTGVDDNVVADAERNATVTHSVTGWGNNVTADSVAVTVSNTTVRGVTVSKSAVTVAETGGTATYTLRLTSIPENTVTIIVATRDSRIARVRTSDDFDELTFTSSTWSVPQTVTVVGVDDEYIDPERTVTIVHKVSNYKEVTKADPVTVTVTSEDVPSVDVFAHTHSLEGTHRVVVSENKKTLYRIKLDKGPLSDVTIELVSADSSIATAEPVLRVEKLTFTRENWHQVQVVLVRGLDDEVLNPPVDDVYRGRRTRILHAIAGGGYGAVSVADAPVVVVDDEILGLKFSTRSLTLLEDGDPGRYEVSLDKRPPERVTLRARRGSDPGRAIADLSPSSLQFEPDHWRVPQPVTVWTRDDDVTGDRIATIDYRTLGAGWNRVTKAEVVVKVLDDDVEPGVVVSRRSLALDEDGKATYTVRLTRRSEGVVTVRPSVTPPGVATVRPRALRFSGDDWAVARTVTVSGVDDGTANAGGGRTARVAHAVEADGAVYGSVTAGPEVAVTVNDDDAGVPGIVARPHAVTLAEGGTGAYTVRLGTPPTGDVTVEAAVSDQTVARLRGASRLVFAAARWDEAQTVTVVGVDDGNGAASERHTTIVHTARGADYGGMSARVAVTVVGGADSEGAPPEVTGVAVVSEPGPDGRYYSGESVRVEVVFSAPVRADPDVVLALDVGGAAREAELEAARGSTLTFAWEAGAHDRDTDGVGVPQDGLSANARGIRGVDGAVARLDLGAHAIRDAAGHPVGPASVPLLLSAASPERQGFVRVVNHGDEAGEVTVRARDDAGTDYDPVTFPIAAGGAYHFSSTHLERGNAARGLEGATGGGTGHWRLELTSARDIEALAYVRHADGLLTSMHDVAPREDGGARLATLNPGSNRRQAGWGRLSHRGAEALAVRVRAADDTGAEPGGAVRVDLAAGGAAQHSSEALEAGTGVSGRFGDGTGKWRLRAQADTPFTLMGLIRSASGHLTNLSGAGLEPVGGTVVVPLFLSGAQADGRTGFLRIINRSDEAGTIEIRASDDGAMAADPLELDIGAGEVVHLSSRDLERGNSDKGLSGATGRARTGHWWLRLDSTLDYEVLAYGRHTDGLLTVLHPSVPVWGGVHRVATFNPASNRHQVSHLRLVNTGSSDTVVRIRGIDSAGASSSGTVEVTVPAGGARTLGARALESGDEDITGALGDGAGKWRLLVEPADAGAPLHVMSLLESRSRHLTNLSTRTATRE